MISSIASRSAVAHVLAPQARRRRPARAASPATVGRDRLEGVVGDRGPELAVAAHWPEPVDERPQRRQGVRPQVLVADAPAQLRVVGVECALHREGSLEPRARLGTGEAKPLLGRVDASHPRLPVKPAAAAHGVHERVDYVAAVADQEDQPRTRKHRHHQRGAVAAVRLLDDDRGAAHGVLGLDPLDLGGEACQDHLAKRRPPGVGVGGREEVVGVGAPRLVEGHQALARQVAGVERERDQRLQVLRQVGLVDRHRTPAPPVRAGVEQTPQRASPPRGGDSAP